MTLPVRALVLTPDQTIGGVRWVVNEGGRDWVCARKLKRVNGRIAKMKTAQPGMDFMIQELRTIALEAPQASRGGL